MNERHILQRHAPPSTNHRFVNHSSSQALSLPLATPLDLLLQTSRKCFETHSNLDSCPSYIQSGKLSFCIIVCDSERDKVTSWYVVSFTFPRALTSPHTFRNHSHSTTCVHRSKPLQIWDATVQNGHVKRITDPDIQSSVVEVMGTNVSTNYIVCPADSKRPWASSCPSW